MIENLKRFLLVTGTLSRAQYLLIGVALFLVKYVLDWEALDYQKYLEKIVELTKKVINPTAGQLYPKALDTPAKRALYDNLNKDEALSLAVYRAIQNTRQDDWRGNPFKIKKVRLAIKAVLKDKDSLTDKILELAKNQNEY
jgi:type I restriction enzyme R subunit